MSKRWIILVVSLIALLMTMPLLTACDDDDDEDGTEAAKTTKTAETAKTDTAVTKTDTFKIGVLAIAEVSKASDCYECVAADAINDAGGFVIGDTRYELDVISKPTKLTTAGAVAAIQELLYDDDVDVVGAPLLSIPVQPYTEDSKILLLGDEQIASYTSLETPYSFRLMSPDDFHISFPVTFEWISKNRTDIKSVYYIGYTYMGAEYVTAIKEAAPNFGLTMLGDNLVEMGTTDFAPVLASVLKKDPDAIIVEQQYGASVIRQARQMGYEGAFILNSSMPTSWYDNLTTEELEGLISMTPDFTSEVMPQWLKDVWQLMWDAAGEEPTTPRAIKYYLRPYVFVALAQGAGSIDSTKMKEVLQNQTLYLELPVGTVELEPFGQEQYGYNCQILVHSPYLSVIRNGKPEIVYAPALEELKALQVKAYPKLFK